MSMNKESSFDKKAPVLLTVTIAVILFIFSFYNAAKRQHIYITKGSRDAVGEISEGITLIQEVPCRKGDLGVSFLFSTYGHRVTGDVTVVGTVKNSEVVVIDQTINGRKFKNNEFADFFFANGKLSEDETLIFTITSASEVNSGLTLLITDDDSIPEHDLIFDGKAIPFDLVTQRITHAENAAFFWSIFGLTVLFCLVSVYIFKFGSIRLQEKFFIFLKFFIVFLLFELVIYYIHVPMEIIGDDRTHLSRGRLDLQRAMTKTKARFSQNGRFLTDGLAFFLYCFPFSWWKLFDTFIYGILVFLLWDLFSNRSLEMLIVCSACCALFPIYDYLSSAGFIATSANYIYTIIGLLLGMLPLIKKIRHQSIRFPFYILSLTGLIYTANQDQTAVMAIGIFFMMSVVYLKRWKIDNCAGPGDIFVCSIIYFVISVMIYGFMFFTPGHISRMTGRGEMDLYLPQYEFWGTAHKVYRGISTTFANLFYCQPMLFQLFCLALLITVYIRNRKLVFISAFLLTAILSIYVLDKEFFITYFDYSGNMPDLCLLEDRPLGFILSVLVFGLLFLSIAALWRSDKNLCTYVFILNIVGFGSRFMMGFSPTLFASSYRTFSPQLFCYMVCDILLIGSIIDFLDNMHMRSFAVPIELIHKNSC